MCFMTQVKKGPLSETSPMLNDISGVATWAKASVRKHRDFLNPIVAAYECYACHSGLIN